MQSLRWIGLTYSSALSFSQTFLSASRKRHQSSRFSNGAGSTSCRAFQRSIFFVLDALSELFGCFACCVRFVLQSFCSSILCESEKRLHWRQLPQYHWLQSFLPR